MALTTMAHEPGAPLRIALLGCGVVGSAVARRLVEHADDLAARVGVPLELVGIAVRRPQRPRPDVPVDPSLFTADADGFVTRADIVIEVIGGIDPARGLILRAMEHGASVVSELRPGQDGLQRGRLRRDRRAGAGTRVRRGRPHGRRRGLRRRRQGRHPPASQPGHSRPSPTRTATSPATAGIQAAREMDSSKRVATRRITTANGAVSVRVATRR